MFELTKFTLISNLIAAAIVIGLEVSTGFFGLNFLSDYAFFIMLLLWGTASLFFMYPPLGGMSSSSDKEDRVADSMVDRTVVDAVDNERFSENTVFCIKLMISGLPAFLTCLILSI